MNKNIDSIDLINDLTYEAPAESQAIENEPVELNGYDFIIGHVENEYDRDEEKRGGRNRVIIVLTAAALTLIVIISACVVFISNLNPKSEAAQRVDLLIDDIGTITLDSGDKILAAETAVEALSSEDEKQLENLDTLKYARAEYDRLVLHKKAADVDALIEKIGEVTLSSADDIKAARKAYNDSADNVKEKVFNLKVLTEAEKKLTSLRIKNVIDLIDAIGSVNTSSEDKIKKALSAYDELSDSEKSQITNYQALVSAKTVLSEMREESKARQQELLSKLTQVTYESDEGSWYYPSVMPQFINDRVYVLPYFGVNSGDAFLCLTADYVGEKLINWHSLEINADGREFSYLCDDSKIERNSTEQSSWESYNDNISDSNIEWLKAVADSDEAEVTFKGDESYTLTVSDEDKQAIKDVLAAYETL